MILFCVLVQNLYAEDNSANRVNKTIVVTETKNLVVYVDKPIVVNSVNTVDPSFNSKSIVGYVNSHIRNSKVKNNIGTYENAAYAYEKIKVYDSETIDYAYSNCSYKKDALKCGYKNNNYTIKTYINIAPHQIAIKLVLYDSDALIVNQSTVTSREYVRWIKQQEVIITQRQSMSGSSTTIHKPKEELPLKWQIPPKIWEKQFYRASINLLTSVKLD